MPLTVVAGWTGPIAMTLKGAGVENYLTGATLELRLWGNDHVEIAEAGTLDPGPIVASGQVRFLPSGTDFALENSPYYARIQVIDALGQKTFYPSDETDVWTVRGVGP